MNFLHSVRIHQLPAFIVMRISTFQLHIGIGSSCTSTTIESSGSWNKEARPLDNFTRPTGLETMCPARGLRDSLQPDTFRVASSCWSSVWVQESDSEGTVSSVAPHMAAAGTHKFLRGFHESPNNPWQSAQKLKNRLKKKSTLNFYLENVLTVIISSGLLRNSVMSWFGLDNQYWW